MWLLVVLFMGFDAISHILHPAFVTDAFIQLGYSPSLAVTIGLLALIPVIFYIIPRTSVFGAILLTGYLGGAVATNVRMGYALFTYDLAPVYVGILLWGALYLLDPRISNLIPLKKKNIILN